jgi:hypothetical protein
LYYNFKKFPTVHNELVYKKYRNKLNHLLKAAERKHYRDLIMINKNNSGKIWSIMKQLINKKHISKTNHEFIDKNGIKINDPIKVCNKFNEFFVGVGSSLASKIPDVNINPMQFMKQRVLNSIYLPCATESEILKIIISLKSVAAGYDEVGANILKLSLNNIISPLTYLCNTSMEQGVFPNEMKLAKVIPLYKGGAMAEFNNYRPVSVLPTLSKVFEKVMYTRISEFLNETKSLFEYQFGFRKSYSSYMPMMILTDKLYKYLDEGKSAIGVFLDFSKAFDTVNHSILIEKLFHYGIRGNALEWLKSYLCNRSQFVVYNGYQSSVKIIDTGVPQGSILGPLLFLIYINDLINVCKYSTPLLFADDTNLFFAETNINVLTANINEELQRVSTWLKVNKLSLNVNKTQYMYFTSKRKYQTELINIAIDSVKINETKQSKFLGVVIDNKLTWKAHISYISNKVSRGIGILLKAKYILNSECLKNLYYAFIYPYLIYCNHIWGNTYVSNLKRLATLQKKAVRIITFSHFYHPSAPLFDTLKLFSLEKINMYVISCFMFRYHHGLLPSIFNDFFVCNRYIHNYDTRLLNSLHIPKVTSNRSKFGIRFHGVKIWNSVLASQININVEELTFKYYLKSFLLSSNL